MIQILQFNTGQLTTLDLYLRVKKLFIVLALGGANKSLLASVILISKATFLNFQNFLQK
jgi:hypothetical protein